MCRFTKTKCIKNLQKPNVNNRTPPEHNSNSVQIQFQNRLNGFQTGLFSLTLLHYLVSPRLCVASPLLHRRPLRLVLLRLRRVKVVVDDTLHHILAIVGTHDGCDDGITTPHIHGQFYLLVVVRPVGVLCHVHHDGSLWLSVNPHECYRRGL